MVWFRDYKLPDGKPASAFGYGGAPLGAAMASRVISDTHALYQARARGSGPGGACPVQQAPVVVVVEVGGVHAGIGSMATVSAVHSAPLVSFNGSGVRGQDDRHEGSDG
jgi:hypothetical protein